MDEIKEFGGGVVVALFYLWTIGRPVARVLYSNLRFAGLYNPENYAKFLGLIGWRGFYGIWLPIRFWLSDFGGGRRATAQFAPLLERSYNVYRSGDILLGRNQICGIPLYQPVGISGKTGRHLCLVANSGSGKTIYLNVLISQHNGNCFVIDCDAQMYNALARRMGNGGEGILGKGKECFVLDAYGLSDAENSASWNPIAEIDAAVERHGQDAAVDFARTLASGLIKSLDNRNEWVYSASRNFLCSLVLWVWAYETPENRNLVRVRDLLTMGLRGTVDDEKYNAFDVLLYQMGRKTELFDGIISRGAEMMKSHQRKTGENPVRADASEQTAWLDLPQLRRICKTSSFKCEDLKLGNASLFFVAPVTDIQGKLSGFVRTLTVMTMEAFQKIPERPKNETLFVMDEFASLGRIDTFISAFAVFRKYSIRCVIAVQTLEILQAAYPDNWGGFIGNSEATIWMAQEHKETLEFLSSILGTHTRSETVKPSLWARLFRREKPHTQQVERPLLYPHQLRELLGRNIIVTRNSKRAYLLKPVSYFRELPVYHYQADRNFAEAPLRRLSRSACVWMQKELPLVRQKLREVFTPKAKQLSGK